MKKIYRLLLVLILTLALLCAAGTAYAAEPITLDVSALDYQTGKPVAKTYVENELFELKVDIGIPRFADTADLTLRIECDGVDLDEPDIILADGTYYLTGVVTDQPAALSVIIEDTAYDNAVTAEELYKAQQNDRTITKTFYFYTITNTASSTYQPTIVIPKTGDASVAAIAIACAISAAVCYKKRGE